MLFADISVTIELESERWSHGLSDLLMVTFPCRNPFLVLDEAQHCRNQLNVKPEGMRTLGYR